MRTLLTSVLGIVIVLGLSSCQAKTTTTSEPLGMETVSTPYYTSSLLREEGLIVEGRTGPYIEDSNLNPQAERTALRVLFLGKRIYGRTNPEFRRLADSVGDGRNSQLLSEATQPIMSISNVSGLSLISVNGYNTRYPAGSSLNDIVQVSHRTYKYRLLEQEPPKEYQDPLDHSAAVVRRKTLVEGLPLEKIALSTIPMEGRVFYEAFLISLTEAPDQPAQTMKLIVTLSNGQVLEHEFGIVIKEFK